MAMNLAKLQSAVASGAAMRRIRRLQPAGGPGDKVFPPTYPGEGRGGNAAPRHVFERRRINGENVLCVLIDSVQSQANRLEEALRIARESGALGFPLIAVDFTNTEVGDIGRITTLDAPHRVFDAIIRDSELDGVRFRETEPGHRLLESKVQNARAVYELSPTALVFGAWNSTGEGGGLGAKFPRCIVSEIVGVGVATEKQLDRRTGELSDGPSGKRTGSRIDPLGIRSGIAVYKLLNGDWSLESAKAKGEGRTEGGQTLGNQSLQHRANGNAAWSEHRLCPALLGFIVCSVAALAFRCRAGCRSGGADSARCARSRRRDRPGSQWLFPAFAL